MKPPLTHKPSCLMLQGTGSNAGKSALAAGLIRLLTNRGMKILPFKPQNMSNNAAVTEDGGEIGRAQAFQAFAAKTPARKLMNPILLKPEAENGSQLIVLGARQGRVTARDYYSRKDALLKIAVESFDALAQTSDMVIIEGAGSPAEINLRKYDIANMGFALAVGAPVILIADIDRGGVIASIIGTYELLSDSEHALMKGYIINKFRGDISLFDDALAVIRAKTGWECLGIVAFRSEVKYFADEDSLNLQNRQNHQTDNALTTIAVARLPHIANADDFIPLVERSDVNLIFAELDSPLPICDWLILPGTKSTIADFHALTGAGWATDIHAHLRRGGKILGICGGYQMLGMTIADPHHIESHDDKVAGLGLLNIETILKPEKTLAQIRLDYQGIAIDGYEIHLGDTAINDGLESWLTRDGVAYGVVAGKDSRYQGQIFGCYLHGIFNNAEFCQRFFGLDDRGVDFEILAGKALDDFANYLENVLDIDGMDL